MVEQPTDRAVGEEIYAAHYAAGFDDFVRAMRGRGHLVSEAMLASAHERATVHAKKAVQAHGYRSLDFARLAQEGQERARARWGR